MRDTAGAEALPEDNPDAEVAMAMARAGALHDLAPSVASMLDAEERSQPSKSYFTNMKMHDGSSRRVNLSDHFKDNYRDEYTNELLPSAWVRDAIYDELDYFNKHVWTLVPEGVAKNDPDAKLIGTRFITNNKGDVHQPDVRARPRGPSGGGWT